MDWEMATCGSLGILIFRVISNVRKSECLQTRKGGKEKLRASILVELLRFSIW